MEFDCCFWQENLEPKSQGDIVTSESHIQTSLEGCLAIFDFSWWVGSVWVFQTGRGLTPFEQWKNPGCLGYRGDYTDYTISYVGIVINYPFLLWQFTLWLLHNGDQKFLLRFTTLLVKQSTEHRPFFVRFVGLTGLFQHVVFCPWALRWRSIWCFRGGEGPWHRLFTHFSLECNIQKQGKEAGSQRQSYFFDQKLQADKTLGLTGWHGYKMQKPLTSAEELESWSHRSAFAQRLEPVPEATA